VDRRRRKTFKECPFGELQVDGENIDSQWCREDTPYLVKELEILLPLSTPDVSLFL